MEKKCNNMQKKVWSRGPGRTPGTKGPRSRGPGRTGPRDFEGPVVLAGQDLETLKVPGLENWESPGTMESLPHTYGCGCGHIQFRIAH